MIFIEQLIHRTPQSLRNVDDGLQTGLLDPVFNVADVRNREVCALRQLRLRQLPRLANDMYPLPDPLIT